MSTYMGGIIPQGYTIEQAFEDGERKGRADAMDKIMPILIDIVDKEGCCYGYEKEIDELEIEWNKLKGQKQ